MLLCAGLDPARQARRRASQADAAGVRDPDPCATASRTWSRTASRDLVINTHHRGDVIRARSATAAGSARASSTSTRTSILGTGGGLKHALPLLDPDGRDEPFLSINGKLIFDLDVTALVARVSRGRGDVLGMMVVRRVPDARAWGAFNVRIDARGPHVDRHPRRWRAHVLRRPRHAARR